MNDDVFVSARHKTKSAGKYKIVEHEYLKKAKQH